MKKELLELRDVVFQHETAGVPVFEGLSVQFPIGWTGVIGANGSGKTTLLRLACGELQPDRGRVQLPEPAVYCPQRTDVPPRLLEEFIEAPHGRARAFRGHFGIQKDWLTRWSTLSEGERKRAQIAMALWREPRVLAVDEPTNHIDSTARKELARALRSFDGIGLLVSHDRDLLDDLCDRCLMMRTRGPVMRRGGYTRATELDRSEKEQLRSAYAKEKRALSRLEREAANRAREAARADSRRSKRRLDLRDHDARDRIDAARVSGKDGRAGRLLRQLEGRLRQANERLSGLCVEKQRRLGIELPGERSRRDLLFRLPAGSLDLGEGRCISFPELSLGPEDRVALTGPNGAGKTTLLRHIVDRLDLSLERYVYMPQEIDRACGRKMIDEMRRLSRTALGDVLTVVSCLGSDPEALLETNDPSPGEVRKLLLALGMVRLPHLIIMDEPTNHLDLPSIECLEEALEACSSALLLVSHDQRFLGRLTTTLWELCVEAKSSADGITRLVTPGRQ